MAGTGVTTALSTHHQHCAAGSPHIGIAGLDGPLGKGQAVGEHPLVLQVQGQRVDGLHGTGQHAWADESCSANESCLADDSCLASEPKQLVHFLSKWRVLQRL